MHLVRERFVVARLELVGVDHELVRITADPITIASGGRVDNA